MNIDETNKTIILKHSLIEKILTQTGMYNLISIVLLHFLTEKKKIYFIFFIFIGAVIN